MTVRLEESGEKRSSTLVKFTLICYIIFVMQYKQEFDTHLVQFFVTVYMYLRAFKFCFNCFFI